MRHLSVGHDEPLRAELISFIESVRDGKPPAVTGEQAVASLEIAIRCLEGRSGPQPLRPAAKGRSELLRSEGSLPPSFCPTLNPNL